VGRAGFEPAKS